MPSPEPAAGRAVEQTVSVSGLRKVYRSGGRTSCACDGIDLQVASGAVTVLLGPNGAGKSTLLKCIAGVLLPGAGEVCVCGEREQERIRAMTGYVGEQPRLDGALTVAEILSFESSLRLRKGKRASGSREELLRQAVARTAIGDVLGKKCACLSKGYAQRVSLAAALCADPALLILDEFSGGLDPAQIIGIRMLLRQQARRKPVIVSTHSIAEALALEGSLAIMKAGKIVARGTAGEIVQKTGAANLEEAFLRLTSS